MSIGNKAGVFTKRIACIFLLITLSAWDISAAGIQIKGRKILVDSSRYTLEFLDGTVTRIQNKLTREIYTSDDNPENILGQLPTGLSSARATPHYHMIENMRKMHQHISGHEPSSELENFPCQHKPFVGSKVTVKQLSPTHVIVTYAGLWDGQELPGKSLQQRLANRQYTFPADTFELDLEIESGTEDLIIKPTARSEYPGICGVAFSLANIKDQVRLIRCMYCGCEELGPEEPEKCTGIRWPSQWAVALIIGKAEKGTFGIWAQDKKAITKYFHLRHKDKTWALTFESMTDAPFGDKWEAEGIAWHFNTFKGDWRGPADRYKEWRAKTFNLVPRSQCNPEWMRSILTTVWSGIHHRNYFEALAKQVPAEKVAIITVPPFSDASCYPAVHWKPNHPLANPVRFKINASHKRDVDFVKKLGFRVITWMPFTYSDANHPIIARFWLQRVADYFEDHTKRTVKEVRIHPGCQEYGRLWLGWMKDVFRQFNTDGMYFDVCPLDGTNFNGRIDGLTVTQGTLKLLHDFKKTFPDKALTGEFMNEMCARRYHLANATVIGHYGMQKSRLRAKRSHPLMQYLFGDQVLMTSWWPGTGEKFHLAMDQEEASGYYPSLGPDDALPSSGTEGKLRLFRVKFFAENEIISYWPKELNPQIKSYWKDKYGNIYGYIWQDGSRFVKLDNESAATGQTIYWRIRNVTKAQIPKGLPNWVGYSGKYVIGLNPKNIYVCLDDPRQKDVIISKLPPGTYLANTRRYNQAVIVEIKSAGDDVLTGKAAFDTDENCKRVLCQGKDLIGHGENGRFKGTVKLTTPATLAFIKEDFSIVRPGDVLSAREPLFSYFNRGTDEATPVDKPKNYFKIANQSFRMADYHPEKAEYLLKIPDDVPISLKVTVTVSATAINNKEFNVLINGENKLKVSVKPNETFSKVISLHEHAGRSIIISLWARRVEADNVTGPHEWLLEIIKS